MLGLSVTDDKTLSQSKPLDIPSTWDTWFSVKWFSVKNLTNISYIQDIVHLGVKLKARLLTHSQVLPMGSYSALSSHLIMLQTSFRKEQHNLRFKDLSHQDRQNFEAVLRIASPNVMTLLDEYPDTKATKYYLQVIKSILDSYLNRDLDPISSITDAWFALFLFATGVNGYSVINITVLKTIL